MSADVTKNAHTEVVVVIGAGAIGQVIARRIGVAKTVLLADINEDAAKKQDELNSPAGEAYQRMIQASASGRVGTPDEISVPPPLS
jgi:threonine dehydrogenase-like Zn-dependent dehydrogenase